MIISFAMKIIKRIKVLYAIIMKKEKKKKCGCTILHHHQQRQTALEFVLVAQLA